MNVTVSRRSSSISSFRGRLGARAIFTSSNRSSTRLNSQTTLLTPRHSPRTSPSKIQTRPNSNKMSFSNTDTGSKTADPYVAKNLEEPSLKEKVEDLGAFVDKSKFCLLTSRTQDGKLVTRAMALAAKEGNGVDFIFHANSESGKTDDLEAHSEVNLGFLNNSGEWASISGDAKLITERETVRKYYSPALKAWLGDLGDGKHDGGPEDPRIVVIKVVSKTVQYAVSRNTAIGSTIELVKGIVTGEAPAVNKLRHLSEQELQQARSS